MVPLGLYFVFMDRNLLLRVGCAALVPLFGYAVYLTGARGGFSAFAAGLGALAWVGFGWRKALAIGVVGLPMLLALFAGRQTEISTQTGTAQTRVELWREWLTAWREHPVFGKGMSLPKEEDNLNRRPDQQREHLAHNSYLQAFADLGVFGGCLFIGAFFTLGWSLLRLGQPNRLILHQEMRTLQPYALAGIATYCVGMLSLSICYTVPTYLMLGFGAAYSQIGSRFALAPP